ncbi:unnamed protein product, partial [Clonostachys solani]
MWIDSRRCWSSENEAITRPHANAVDAGKAGRHIPRNFKMLDRLMVGSSDPKQTPRNADVFYLAGLTGLLAYRRLSVTLKLGPAAASGGDVDAWIPFIGLSYAFN